MCKCMSGKGLGERELDKIRKMIKDKEKEEKKKQYCYKRDGLRKGYKTIERESIRIFARKSRNRMQKL